MPQTQKPNRLIREKSPYLLQHARNPVDWYPWGEEAFEKARREDKPVLVSIGYSTCHWCHVMERESFEDPAVAAVMNQHLVCIKVDREERPDVDKIYMTAVSAMAGGGGWPLNAFLTPGLKPFYGGTYFPPEPRFGRIGWPQLVERLGQAWRDPEQRKKMLEAGDNVLGALSRTLGEPGEARAYDARALDGGFEALRAAFDGSLGGFGYAPKFPMPVNQNFLLRYHDFARRAGKVQEAGAALRMALDTLRSMSRGGIYDHLGGGFARYSTDARWHVPHFEKMLYDNAQLAVNCVEAYQLSRDEDLARVARETLDYLRRDMTHPEGGFYSAEDADSLSSADADHKKEGAFYVWERAEILGLLGPKDGEIFCFRYGVEPGGNVQEDPHGEFPEKNVLYEARTIAEAAKKFDLSEAEAAAALARGREKLFAVRAKRPRPHLDDKIITAWNGLAISAFARAYQALGRPEDLSAASRAAGFIRKNLYDEGARSLFRRWREGERDVPGMADDYAFLVQGLIDLYEAALDPRWLLWAVELAEGTQRRFYDGENGGFFMTAEGHDKNVLLRVREEMDNVEPSAASVAALNLLRLAQFTDRADFRQAAEKTLSAFAGRMEDQPRSLPQMLCALAFALSKPRQIVIAGDPAAPETSRMLEAVHRRFLPQKILIGVDGGERQKTLAGLLPFLQNIPVVPGKSTAHVCVDYACRLPASDPRGLSEQLDEP